MQWIKLNSQDSVVRGPASSPYRHLHRPRLPLAHRRYRALPLFARSSRPSATKQYGFPTGA